MWRPLGASILHSSLAEAIAPHALRSEAEVKKRLCCGSWPAGTHRRIRSKRVQHSNSKTHASSTRQPFQLGIEFIESKYLFN